jgi:hypothetical protein
MAGVVVVTESSDPHRAVSDAEGSYRLDGLPLGSHIVSARKVGYYVERREIAVNCPVRVTGVGGTAAADAGSCDPSPARLNFYLRPEIVR